MVQLSFLSQKQKSVCVCVCVKKERKKKNEDKLKPYEVKLVGVYDNKIKLVFFLLTG